MNKLTPVVTTVTRSGNRLVFHRVWLETESGPPPSPVTVSLDPDESPLFGKHPERGWVSPPYEQLAEMQALGLEPESVNHVVCPCQRTISSGDLASLESCGHAAGCRRALHAAPGVAAPLPPPGQPPAGQNGVSNDAYSYIKDAAARALLSEDAPVPGVPPKPDAPAGGLTTVQLEELMTCLMGEGEECQLTDGIEMAHIRTPGLNLQVVAHQLFAQESFSRCVSCKSWGRVGPDRTCGNC